MLAIEQYQQILPFLERRLQADEFGMHTIGNIYYDTNTYDLIRTSIEKPQYKEKFRVRSYGTPKSDAIVFAEIKKKFDGIVYKRRIAAPSDEINLFLENKIHFPEHKQIQREILWFFQMYDIVPKVFIGYERVAYFGKEDASIRVTFDQNIRWRRDALTLEEGMEGQILLPDEMIVMEVKVPYAMPLWLTALLNEFQIYTTGFSKYGTCYQQNIAPYLFTERMKEYVK